MAIINSTSYDFLNIFDTALVEQFTGSPLLGSVALLLFIVVVLMIIGARREAVLIVPMPMVLAMVNTTSLPAVFKILGIIAAWSYMLAVIFTWWRSRG